MIKRLLSWIIALICLVLLFLSLLITPSGLKISLYLADKILPGTLSYQHADGLITGPLTLTDLHYTTQNNDLSINSLSLNWNLAQALSKKIAIQSLNVEGITYTSHQNNTSYSTLPKINLPFFTIKDAQLHDITIKHNDTIQASIKEIAINGVYSPSALDISLSSSLTQPYTLQNTLTIKGSPQKYTLDGGIVIDNGKTYQMTGQGSPNSLHLNTSSASPISANLDFSFLPAFSWNINITGKDIPATAHTDPISSLSFHTQGKKSTDKTTFNVSTDIISTANTLQLSIAHNTTWQGSWNINLTKSFPFMPYHISSLQSEGNLSGDLDNPKSTGTLSVNSISFQESKVHTLAANWSLIPNTASTATITANNVKLNTVRLTNINISATGTRNNHTISTSYNIGKLLHTFTLSGNYNAKQWSGNLTRMILRTPNKKIYSLVKTTPLSFTNHSITIPSFCLAQSSQASLCALITWNKNTFWKANITGKNIPTSNFFLDTAKPLEISATSQFSLQATGDKEKLQQVIGSFNLGKGYISSYKYNQKLTRDFNDGSIKVDFQNNTLKSTLNFNLTNKDLLTGKINLYQIDSSSPKLDGNLTVKLTNLSPFNQLIPATVIKNSILSGKFTLGGTLTHPTTTGNLTFNAAHIFLSQIQLTLNNVAININANKSQITTDIKATNNKQPISITSKTTINKGNYDTTATIQGKNLIVMNTPHYKIYASPNLSIIGHNSTINVTGDILIPSAIIKPDVEHNLSTLPMNDIKYTSEKSFLNYSSWDLSSKITATFGDDVHLDLLGIHALMEGGVDITKHPGQTFLANGHILVSKGTYTHYGHTLTVEPESSLIFTNTPIISPTINIRASNTIQAYSTPGGAQTNSNFVTVGIQLTGLITKPDISLYSIPNTLSQTTILSYLILGNSGLSETNNSDSSNDSLNNLITALNAMRVGESALSSYGGFTNQINKALGLSELGVEQHQTLDAIGNELDDQTTLVVGRYITSNLYFRYKYQYNNDTSDYIELFNDYDNIYQLNYKLNDHWSIEATQSSGKDTNQSIDNKDDNSAYGIDLLYQFSID